VPAVPSPKRVMLTVAAPCLLFSAVSRCGGGVRYRQLHAFGERVRERALLRSVSDTNAPIPLGPAGSAARPRLHERQDKPYKHRHHDNPQNHKENNDGSNDYRSESFHYSLYFDYVHLPGTDQKCRCRTRRPGGEWLPPGTSARFSKRSPNGPRSTLCIPSSVRM
jgi:hypothetical protein